VTAIFERLSRSLSKLLDASGALLAVLPLAMVMLQFMLVLSVHVFALSSIQLQESLAYINALIFLGGAGYTALHGGHVRVDILYSGFTPRKQALVTLLGSLFLLVPFLIFLWATALPFVAQSWAIFETSVDAGGLPFVYLLKSCLLIFAASLSLAVLVDIGRSLHSLRKVP